MGIKLKRQKKRNFMLSVLYKVFKIKILTPRKRFKLFLDLEWIFNRLAHEESYKIYEIEKHPIRINTLTFISKFLKKSDKVFDLGCNSGDLSYLISKFVFSVTGVDYNEKLIKEARLKYPVDNINFIASEADTFLESNDTKFDVLILSHILEHLNEPDVFLKKYTHYFNYVYIEIPDFEASFSNLYREKLNLNLIYTDNDHVSEFDRFEMTKIIFSSNLEIIESEFKNGYQRFWCKTI